MRLLDIHRELVSTPSVSHNETAIADKVEAMLKDHGIKTSRFENNVLAWKGEGKRLLLNSHLDTVPPNDAWTRDPWAVENIGGRIFGLGSNDAKASGAAMIETLLNHEGPGEICLMLVPEEETGGRGTEVAWPWLLEQGWKPDGIVVGEPTELNIGIAQKGLMVLELYATGDACHAANATRLGAKNPIFELCQGLSHLEGFHPGDAHAELGPTTVQPTQLRGAQTHNQVPGEAVAVVDVRTVPGLSHAQVVDAIRMRTRLEVRERSTRLEPFACRADSDIVRAAMRTGGGQTFASPTMSDQVFFRGWPAIKCGPGVSARSHSADEFVLESELIAGAEFYGRLVHEFATMG